MRLATNRGLPSWELMKENAVLRDLGAQQRTTLQAALEHLHLEEGRVLWETGAPATDAWLIEDATVEVKEEGHDTVSLGRAALLCDVEAFLRGRPLSASAVCTRGGAAFRVPGPQLAELVERSPGLLLALSGARFVP